MATKSIGATGRDYATLALWASYVDGLDTLSAAEVGEMYNDAEFTDGADLTGFVASATFTVNLRCATGHSFKDDANVRTNPLFYDVTKGVGVTINGAGNEFKISADYVTVTGIQFKRTASNYSQGVLNTAAALAQNTSTFKDCIVGKTFSGTQSVVTSRNQRIINCLVYDTGGGANALVGVSNGYSGGTAINCTLVRSGSAVGKGFEAGYFPTAVNNCAVFNCTTAFATFSGGSFTGNYNATDAASGAPGANSQHNVTYSTSAGAYFENISNDWRIKSSSVFVNAGNTDATNAPNDITGLVRGVGTAGDIGAWEYFSGVVSPPAMGKRIYILP